MGTPRLLGQTLLVERAWGAANIPKPLGGSWGRGVMAAWSPLHLCPAPLVWLRPLSPLQPRAWPFPRTQVRGLGSPTQVVYVARNPKDVLVSFYHFHKLANFLPDPSSFDDFMDEFLEGTGGSWGPWWLWGAPSLCCWPVGQCIHQLSHDWDKILNIHNLEEEWFTWLMV